MNLVDAFLCLVLAAKIHGTDQKVRAVAKRVVKRVPGRDRQFINRVAKAKHPLQQVLVALEKF